MSSERVDCRRKADDARQRAAQASEPFMRSAYVKVAERRSIALVVRALRHWLGGSRVKVKLPENLVPRCRSGHGGIRQMNICVAEIADSFGQSVFSRNAAIDGIRRSSNACAMASRSRKNIGLAGKMIGWPRASSIALNAPP
jgi:hypothetical protein